MNTPPISFVNTWDNLSMPNTEKPSPSVLIIDDGTLTLNVLKNMLQESGCSQIWTADNGSTGFHLYSKHLPDLTFMDINMPGQNGHQILAKLKEQYPDIYVVMVTSEATKENLDIAVANGAKGFIVKPFQLENIEKALNEFHRHRKLAPTAAT